MKAYLAIAGFLGYGIYAFVHLATNQGAAGAVRRGKEIGAWGDADASVDWCEENFLYSPWIAEFHNTISSLFIVAAGLGAFLQYRAVGCEQRYQLLGLMLALVGIGSMLFHATLLRIMQALDEVPMLWVATAGSYIMLEHPHLTPRHAGKVPAIVAYVTAISAWTTFTHGQIAVAAFHFSFVPGEVFFMIKATQLCLRTSIEPVRRTLRLGLLCYGFAIVAWVNDIVHCHWMQNLELPGPFAVLGYELQTLPNPQLHAYGWHLLVAFATYCMAIGVAAEREVTIRRRSVGIKTLLGVVPYLSSEQQ